MEGRTQRTGKRGGFILLYESKSNHSPPKEKEKKMRDR